MKQIIKMGAGMLGGVVIGLSFFLITVFFLKGCSLEACIELVQRINLGTLAFSILIAFVCIILSLFLQIIIHEGGHLLFGLLTGYKFVSFRVGKYTLIKEKGKYKIKHFAIAGTGGQCLLTLPEDKRASIPYFWYNLGGVLLNLILSLPAFILWLTLPDLPLLIDVFLIIFAAMGLIFALLNGIPMKVGGVGNDGYNLKLLIRNPESRTQFVNQLLINGANQEGIRLIEMPDSWFINAEDINFGDAIQCSNYNIYASRHIDAKDFEKAHQLFDKAYEHRSKIIGLFQKEMASELLFLELIGENRPYKVNELYSKELESYIKTYANTMSSKKRLQLALALFQDNDYKKAEAIYKELEENQHQYLMQGEVKSDLEVMQEIMKRVATEKQG